MPSEYLECTLLGLASPPLHCLPRGAWLCWPVVLNQVALPPGTLAMSAHVSQLVWRLPAPHWVRARDVARPPTGEPHGREGQNPNVNVPRLRDAVRLKGWGSDSKYSRSRV